MIHFFEGVSYFFLCSCKISPLSLRRTLMFPLLDINCRRACMKVYASMLQVHSICTALLTKHVKSAPYLLSSFLSSFMRNGPNISMPQLVNLVHLIFFRLVGHLLFTKFSSQQSTFDTFPYKTSDNNIAQNYPKTITSDFIYGKLPSTMCYLLVVPPYNQSGMLPSLPSNTGWTTLRCRLVFFNLPPTLNKPFSSMYGSRLCMPLLLLNDFLMMSILPFLRWSISLMKTCCWCSLITSCCAYSSNDT